MVFSGSEEKVDAEDPVVPAPKLVLMILADCEDGQESKKNDGVPGKRSGCQESGRNSYSRKGYIIGISWSDPEWSTQADNNSSDEKVDADRFSAIT